MSTYYVSLSRYWPKGRPNKFVGEFHTQNEAQKEIERVNQIGTLELVEDENKMPIDLERAVQVSIIPKIAARRIGLKSPVFGDKKNTLIGSTIPTSIDEIDPIIVEKLKENHNGKKDHKTIVKKNGAVHVEDEAKAEEKIIDERIASVTVNNNNREEDNKMLASIRDLDRINNEKGLHEEYIKLAQTDVEEEPINVTKQLAKNKTDVKYVVVTWFKGEIEWLKLQGIDAEEIERVYSPDQLEGKIVIGFVPDHLLYRAKEVWHIYKPRMKPVQRGKDLTAQELIEAGARFDKYIPARKIEND